MAASPLQPGFKTRCTLSFREKDRLELIGVAFNLYNHFNATSVTTLMYTVGGTAVAPAVTYNPNFGTITNANNNKVLGPRQIQLGAKGYVLILTDLSTSHGLTIFPGSTLYIYKAVFHTSCKRISVTLFLLE